MKKTLFFLACIIGLLTSCTQDEDLLGGSTQTREGNLKARIYGVKKPDGLMTRGVADEVKLWSTKNGIPIKFLNEPSDPAMLEKIKDIAREWEQYAGITFNFVESSAKADVRIAFDWNGNDYLTWSYTGTDARYVRKQTEPTAVFGGLENLYEEELRADVLRLFGQILGLEYEQRHQDWSFWWNEERVRAYWENAFEGLDFDWEEVRDYVYTPLDGNNSMYPNQTPELDELSIMIWPLYSRSQTTKVLANFELSAKDKEFISELYPKDPVDKDGIKIIPGRANVLAQYSAQEFYEFVRWNDGGVAYIVYNDTSAVSPGAKVKGLPGVKDPSKVYVADNKGQFIVPKEDLPVDLTEIYRFGSTTEVEYVKSTGKVVKETSAPNTYVPNKMHLKLVVNESNAVYLSNYGYMYVYYQVLRKTDPSKDWERIPSYLGNLTQRILAYELSDSTDPSSYDPSTSKSFATSYVSINSSSTMSVTRLRKASPYAPASNSSSLAWDGKDHYFNLVLESYYGESPNANVVIKMPPIQYGPILKNVKAYGYDQSLNIFSKVTGEFDFGSIDESLIFKTYLTEKTMTQGTESFRYLYPELTDVESIKDTKIFTVSFQVSENTADNSANKGSISVPSFVVSTPYLGSSVYVSTYSTHFAEYSYIGSFKFDETSGNLQIKGVNNTNYVIPNIPVEVLP